MRDRWIRASLVAPLVMALFEAADGSVAGTMLAVASVLGGLVARDLVRAGGVR
jgi:hypothetical protein